MVNNPNERLWLRARRNAAFCAIASALHVASLSGIIIAYSRRIRSQRRSYAVITLNWTISLLLAHFLQPGVTSSTHNLSKHQVSLARQRRLPYP